MTVTFFINYLNHHQQPVADEMFGLLGEDFRFVATFPRDENALKGGQDYSTRPYCILAAESDEANAMAHRLVKESDLCVFGAGNLYWERLRAKTGKLSFEVSERWFKRGTINILSPRLIEWWWTYQTKLRGRNFYKLCASAYTSSDCAKLLTYRNRSFKWGYFTDLSRRSIHDPKNVPDLKPTVKIIWVGRFIKWKHPELAVFAAKMLAQEQYDFVLEMYGDGVMREYLQKLIDSFHLNDRVVLMGRMPNDKVLRAMSESDIFLFTSDRNEGWGAVLNEAMGCGCCVLANDAIGAVPYLVRDGVNGVVYHNGNQLELNKKLRSLMDNPTERGRLGAQARKELETIWSPRNAAECLLKLSECLINGEGTPIDEGPCSKA